MGVRCCCPPVRNDIVSFVTPRSDAGSRWFCAVELPKGITSKTTNESAARVSLGVGPEGSIAAVFPMHGNKSLNQPKVAINWKRFMPIVWTKWPRITQMRRLCEKASLPESKQLHGIDF